MIKVARVDNRKASFETFFQQVSLNPNAHLITGLICWYRVEEIENPLTQKVRFPLTKRTAEEKSLSNRSWIICTGGQQHLWLADGTAINLNSLKENF